MFLGLVLRQQSVESFECIGLKSINYLQNLSRFDKVEFWWVRKNSKELKLVKEVKEVKEFNSNQIIDNDNNDNKNKT